MNFVNISHKKIFTGRVVSFSDEADKKVAVSNVLKETGFWKTKKRTSNSLDFFIVDYQESNFINEIEISPSLNGFSVFPKSFRLESSLDGESWQILHLENKIDLKGLAFKVQVPLLRVRYLKFIITESPKVGSHFFSEIGSFLVGRSGVKEILASSFSSSKKNPQNLLEKGFDQFWQSALNNNFRQESIFLDLGQVYHLNRIVLSSVEEGFPEDFSFEASVDNSLWFSVEQIKGFKAESFKKYLWNFNSVLARYFKFEAKTLRMLSGLYGIQIAEIEVFGKVSTFGSSPWGEKMSYASAFEPGIVRLALNKEDLEGKVVQGNDSRLKGATNKEKGIVQLAEDGERKEGLVVQSSDSRLKEATELNYGIVRFSSDQGKEAKTAVQASDSRLKEASEQNFGVVKLCPNGLYSEQGVLTGNDQRIQKASTESYGICLLGKDGENKGGVVVQGDDKRLRDASTTYKGIVKLAKDGEDKEGVVVQGDDKRLKEATTLTKGLVELAEDGENRKGVVVQGNDRRLREATTLTKGLVELAENGENREGVVVQGDDKRLRDASTAYKGIVRLAKDGEDKGGVVVQGDDKRLREATTQSKGLVELAEDGETNRGVVVQGNDKRLREATTTYKGIVRLANDGEERRGVVVQGDDKRLREATTGSKGLVELAENGESKEGVVVQGNDKRLREATTTYKGIVKLAKDGEAEEGVAVQGNDKRLREATTTYKGIVKLAKDGEAEEGVAVQSNDKRLREATTTYKGIVKLAKDGESEEGVVVQGNDKRLREATTTYKGIVKLAKDGEVEEGTAVQSNDKRLWDAREPLPHSHEYAAKKHDLNSHQGTLSIKGEKSEGLKGITPPSDDSSLVYAKNFSKEKGSIGLVGLAGDLTQENKQAYGVFGHSHRVGVRGQAIGSQENKGCGVLGVARVGAGGVFSSERDFSLVADGFGTISSYDSSLEMEGNGDALYVKGKSIFEGQIFLGEDEKKRKDKFPLNLVEMFEVDEDEYISPGDLLMASSLGNSVLSRSRGEYQKGVIGVVSGHPNLIINNSGKKKKIYPVTLAGKVLCRVDARKKKILPGCLIVSSNTAGCGMKGEIDSFEKIGSVIGKALDKIEEGIGLIPIFLNSF